MTIFATQNMGVFIFGILGNIASFVVFLAPLPTFYRVWKKKSTEGFQSVPYVIALFSAMMWLYYATLKSDLVLLITINSVGCVIETIYIAFYIAFAPKQTRLFTLRLLLLVNFGGFCLILLLSHFLAKGPIRAQVLGWVCTTFAVSVFAAPLSIIRVVIRTKSVEFMPFPLSFFLTLSAVMWLFYGILLKDMCVAIPNVLGLFFGILQMVLYWIYKNKKPTTTDLEEQKLPVENKLEVENKLDSVVEVQVMKNTDEETKEKEKEIINVEPNNVNKCFSHDQIISNSCAFSLEAPPTQCQPVIKCEA
ncbi:hypothetical protein UlMin_007619 [Ulmus minor]